jgi:hypothetical protein
MGNRYMKMIIVPSANGGKYTIKEEFSNLDYPHEVMQYVHDSGLHKDKGPTLRNLEV